MKKNIKHEKKIPPYQNKTTLTVYLVLRALVIFVLVRAALRRDFESVFMCSLTLVLMILPSFFSHKLNVELPTTLEVIILLFIFAAEILGELNSFYVRVPNWDTMLHTLNGFLAAAVGFSMVILLNDNEKLTFELSPFFLALLAFCFSMTIGVLWEFFEFFMDTFLHTDMQKDTIIHTIHSVTLDPTRSNQVVTIHNIQDVAVNGSSLGLPGYLDIGLIDTMKDLMVNFLGALVFSVTGFFYARSKGKKKTPAQNFVPSKKTADRDYLQQARQALTPPEEPPEDP